MSDRLLYSAIRPPIIVDDEETRRVVEIARAAASRRQGFDFLAFAWPAKGAPPEVCDFGGLLSAIKLPPPLCEDEKRAIIAEARVAAAASEGDVDDCPITPIVDCDGGHFYLDRAGLVSFMEITPDFLYWSWPVKRSRLARIRSAVSRISRTVWRTVVAWAATAIGSSSCSIKATTASSVTSEPAISNVRALRMVIKCAYIWLIVLANCCSGVMARLLKVKRLVCRESRAEDKP